MFDSWKRKAYGMDYVQKTRKKTERGFRIAGMQRHRRDGEVLRQESAFSRMCFFERS
jgi:hypothetical protein